MKMFKKTISLILALILVLSCGTAIAFAADEDNLPLVYVTGFASANIYYENDPEKKPLFFPFDTDRLLGNLNNMGTYLEDAIKNVNGSLVSDCVYDFLWDSFGMLRMTPEGTSIEGVAVEPTTLTYEDGRYVFYYDSRKDPVILAAELDDYIELVKEATGSDRIELVGSSYGVNVVIAYLSVYQDSLEDIDSVLLCVPSTGGISAFGELMSGEFNVDIDTLTSFLRNMTVSAEVDWYLKVLNQTGVLDLFVKALAVPALRDTIYEAVLQFGKDCISTIPAIWVTVTDEYFEKALSTLFGEDYASPDHEYAKTIADAIYYHENIMMKHEDILLQTTENYEDLHLAVICKYGSPAIPLSKYSNLMEDGLASLYISSFGATCSNYGETLGDDYKQTLYTEYNFLSVDGVVDASTCLFPFTTWYLKGLGHSQKNTDYWNMLDTIVHNDLDVFADENYPQFMMVSPEDEDKLVPLSAEDKVKLTHFERFVNKFIDVVVSIYNKVVSLFEKIGNSFK